MRGRYVLKRLFAAAVTVVLAVSLNFFLFRAAPGDPVNALACQRCPSSFKASLKQQFGLDRSKPEQYAAYMGQLAQGNLGSSFRTRRPVVEELKTPLLNTLPMVALGTGFAIVVGSLIGLLAAWRRGTVLDRLGTFGSLVFYSMPAQWLGMLMIGVFSGVLPTSGVSDPFLGFTDPSWTAQAWDRIGHLLLPSLTLGLVLAGNFALLMRSSLLQTLGDDYVLTARAKGLSSWGVVRRHALPNSLLPTVTLAALSLGYLVGGTILVETVFSYRGVGYALYQAIFARDYPVLQGAFLLLTVAVILANLLLDLLYPKLDPRIVAT